MARFPRTSEPAGVEVPRRIEPEWILHAGRFELDLGSARGRFLLARAREAPTARILGIERQTGRVLRCVRAIARLELDNARAIQGAILETLATRIPSASTDCAHILFPDPWPKRRHATRRLVNPVFLDQLARVLKPAGLARLLTDSAEYHTAAAFTFRACGWQVLPDDPVAGWPATEFQSRFAARGTQPHGLLARPPQKPSRRGVRRPVAHPAHGEKTRR